MQKKVFEHIVNFIYSLPRILFINFYRIFIVRIRIAGPGKIPDEKSAIFAFNHTTGADPIIALGALRKKLHFIAESERFKTRFTNFFFRKFTNSIPIFKKEFLKNTGSFKELFSISRQKKIFFGIFPEGSLVKNNRFGKFHSGAAYLSYKTRIPIIPVYIHNIHKGPKPGSRCDRNPVLEGICSLFLNTFRKIHVFIGQPIDPIAECIFSDLKELADKRSYKKIIEKITAKLEEEFIELKDEADMLFVRRIENKSPKPNTSESIGMSFQDIQDDDMILADFEDEDLAHLS